MYFLEVFFLISLQKSYHRRLDMYTSQKQSLIYGEVNKINNLQSSSGGRYRKTEHVNYSFKQPVCKTTTYVKDDKFS